LWIVGGLPVPTVGLYGTSYLAACQAIQPVNPNARYLQVKGPVAGILVQSVLEAIEKRLAWLPRR
jgi:hypothetical protein